MLKIATGIGALVIAICAIIILAYAYFTLGIYVLIGLALVIVGLLTLAKIIAMPKQYGILIMGVGVIILLASMIV